MKPHRITVFSAAFAVALSLGAAAPASAARVHPDTFVGTEYGVGPTLADAKWAAESQMYGDYFGCQTPFLLVGSGQNPDGGWWAELQAAGCQGYN